MWWAVWIGSFWPKIEVLYRPECTKEGTTWKWILSFFKIRNELQTVRAEKVDEKKFDHLSSFHLPSWLLILKLSSAYFADLTKKSKSTKAMHTYASEKYCYALSENGVAYYAMTYCFGDIGVWNQRILLNFCWFSIFFDILIAKSLSRGQWLRTIQTISFSVSVMRTFRRIYVNSFTRLRFLAEVSTILQKMHFFGQFKDHNQGRNHGK